MPVLVQAIQATFQRRGTELPGELPLALTPEFAEDPTKQIQWNAFIRKASAPAIRDLQEVVESVVRFIADPLRAAAAGFRFEKKWSEKGPWVS